jgi:hypothetical protein
MSPVAGGRETANSPRTAHINLPRNTDITEASPQQAEKGSPQNQGTQSFFTSQMSKSNAYQFSQSLSPPSI